MVILQLFKISIPADKTKYPRTAAKCKGVSEQTTAGAYRRKEMATKGVLLCPAINVNDCVTTSKFDDVYDCSHSLPGGIMRATGVMIGDKRALDCGYGDAGKPAHSPCAAPAPAYWSWSATRSALSRPARRASRW